MKKIISLLLAVSFMAGLGTVFAAQNSLNPDTSTWFVYEYPKAADVAGTPLDVSSLLDAPAGKHGFLTDTDDQHFVFEDGTEIRFNGVNISLDIPFSDYDDAKEVAARIAQSGYNIVRFHCMDGGHTSVIWERRSDGGRHLRQDIMDRICFLMSELKKRGVYYLMDLTVAAPPVSDVAFKGISNLEEIGSGFKMYSYFNEDLKQVTKDIAAAMLNYYNPYVGLRIKDDPALALIDIKNEDFISSNASSSLFASKAYEAELQAMFNEWLKTKYSSDDALRTAWQRHCDPNVSDTTNALESGESMANGTVRLYSDTLQFYQEDLYADGRQVDRAEFLDKVQKDYFAEMMDYLRGIGVKCRITGVTAFTNTGIHTQMIYSNINTDFIDNHTYSNLGAKNNNYIDGVAQSNETGEVQIMKHDTYSILGESIAFGVYGLPHTVTEWNHTGPNKYRAEAFVIMPAFASLHGMHQFAFTWACGESQQEFASYSTDTLLKQGLTIAEAPESLAGLPNAARMFLREDVKETTAGYYPIRHIGKEPYIYDQKLLQKNTEDQVDLVRAAGLVGKTGFVFDERYSGPKENGLNDAEVLYLAKKGLSEKKYLSATGEILSDVANNIVKVNTAKTQAVTGAISGQTVELSDIKVNITNPYATVSYSSVEDKPLCQTGSNLLTVLGDSRNTGMVLNDSTGYMTIENAGTAPILVEPILGTITIKTTGDVTVYPLTSSGQRKAAKTVTSVSGGKQFTMEASDAAMNYEIVIANGSSTQGSPVSLGSTTMPDIYTGISGHQYEKEIEDVMMYAGVWNYGNSATAFNPDSSISKRDFCIWLIQALRLDDADRKITQSFPNTINDLGTSASGYKEMAIAYRLGAIQVEESGWIIKTRKVNPDATLTVNDAKAIVNTILGRTYRGKTNYVTLADSTSTLTRAQAAKMIYDVMWQK